MKVGTKYWIDAAAPATMGVGPRVRNIRSLQKCFRDDVYKNTLEQNKQQVEASENQPEEPLTHEDEDRSDEANR